jgi:O-antigen ligase
MPRPSESNGGTPSPVDRLAELVATYGPAAVILTLPLEFTSVYLRQQLSRFVLALLLLAFLYLIAVRRRSLRVPRSASVVLLLAYVVVSVMSWLATRSPGSTSSLLDVVLYPMVALLLANCVVNERDHRRAWNAFLVSALGVSVLGLFLYISHLSLWTPNPLVASRLNITFADPNITARFLTLGACVAILMFAERQSPAWMSIATGAACAVVLPLTFSRSGLGLFVLTAVLAVVVAFQRRRAAVIAAITLAMFLVATGVNPSTRQRAEDAAATVASAVIGHAVGFSGGHAAKPDTQNAAEDNRVYLVKAGLKMFADHPLTGVGFGGYQHALLTRYRDYLPTRLNAANLDTLSHASMITALAEQGVIGALLLLAFLVALGVEAWRARGPWTLIPATLIVPIFVYSQIEGRLIQEPYLWLAVGLLYSAMALRRRESARLVELPEAA